MVVAIYARQSEVALKGMCREEFQTLRLTPNLLCSIPDNDFTIT